MKRLLNTLFVTTQGAYLCRDGETVSVRADGETKLRVPIHNLGGIVCFGEVACSSPLMGLCGENNVALSFLTETGKFLARVQGQVCGNVLLRRQQYRLADEPQQAAQVARVVVTAKLANCRVVLGRILRDWPDGPGHQEIRKALDYLAHSLGVLEQPAVLDVVRGIEGEAARTYFSVFDHLITMQKEGFRFTQRSRRPPLDNINALLSFLYTLLVHDCRSALETVGLDPAVGFLHADRPGRPSLALDLMEELRPVLADRMALSLINRQQIKAAGFTKTESGAVMMDDDTRKAVLVAWQKRKQEEFVHPFLDEKINWGLLPHIQALLLARYIRGDLEEYPPFFWK
jgi:CRISPR-associated protein Cas1